MPAPLGNANARGARTAEQRDRMRRSALLRNPETRRAQQSAMLGNRFVVSAPVIGECAYCGAPATTRDHVVPVRRGGTDDPSNIVVACHPCNASKRTRTPEEWLAVGLRES